MGAWLLSCGAIGAGCAAGGSLDDTISSSGQGDGATTSATGGGTTSTTGTTSPTGGGSTTSATTSTGGDTTSTTTSTGGDTTSTTTGTGGAGGGSTSTTTGAGGGPIGPTGIALSDSTPLAQIGNAAGGSPFNETCPAGQALIGFTGALQNAGGSIGQIQALCGALQLSASAPYTVTTTGGMTFPTHGAATAAPWSAVCPTGSVVIGFEGRGGLLVDQITLHCAPLVISGPPYTIALGSRTALPPVGGNGGSPFPVTDCPAGQIATMSRTRAGDSVDAFGLACSAVSLTF